MKKILWKQLHTDDQEMLVIDPSDIVQKVDFHNQLVYKFHADEIDENDVTKLETLLPELRKLGWNPEGIEEIFQSAGLKAQRVGDSEEITNKNMQSIYYFHEAKCFGKLEDCEAVPVYSYWDGSNWRELWFDEVNMEETVVVLEDTHDNLDQWNGNNWNYGGKFSHGRIYPIVNIDGEEVEGKYLLYTYTDYQDDIPRGMIITAKEREELLSAISS